MSLDVSLYKTNFLTCDCGKKHELERECVYNSNITHNLGDMAKMAGIYYVIWRPEEVDVKLANEIINPLQNGYNELLANPNYFKQFNSENGWGIYDNLLSFVLNYLNACKKYPDAIIEVDR